MKSQSGLVRISVLVMSFICCSARAQLVDNTQAPNTSKAGINKSLADEIGAGRGDIMIPSSSLFIINRDPFRAIRRGRQIFQRKFTREQGQGPNNGDGHGDINTIGGIGAGLSDSCASCLDVRAAQGERAATSPRVPIAAMLHICLDWD